MSIPDPAPKSGDRVRVTEVPCPKCGKTTDPQEHSCPFQADVHDDDTPCCICCFDCVQECIDGI